MPKRDEPGPKHSPEVIRSRVIEGVRTLQSPSVTYLGDKRLTELHRPEWPEFFESDEPIVHLYMVQEPTGGTRTEWYYHEAITDRYLITSGILEMGAYDGRVSSKTYKGFEVVRLGEPGSGLPNGVRIPPFVWHSLKWVTNSGSFVNAKTIPYNPENPDKIRVNEKELPVEIDWPIT